MSKRSKPKLFERKNLTKSITLFVGLALSILFFFAIFYIGAFNVGLKKFFDSIKPFIYGGVIAYLLVPPCNFFNRIFKKLFAKSKKIKPKTAANLSDIFSIAISFILAVLLIYLLLSLIIPQLVDSISVIVNNFDGYYTRIKDWVNSLFANNQVIHDYIEGITDSVTTTIQTWLKTDILPNAKSLVANVSSGVLSAFSLIKNLFIGIVVSLYFLKSRKSLAKHSKVLVHSLFKEKLANKIIGEFQFANKMFMGFISGRLVDSAIIGVLCFIGLTILKIPYPLLISVIVGVTNIVPFFGPFIGGIPAGFLILVNDPIKCLWFAIFIVILQQIDGNIIGPKIVGEMTNLNSFWVLFSILLFGGMFGFIGMIIGVPVFAVIYHLAQELLEKGKKRTGYVPESDSTEDPPPDDKTDDEINDAKEPETTEQDE